MKIDDLSLWQAFQRVARERSFTRAAESLRIGAPLLSKRINRLEETLGTRLFQRSTRRVNLTDEGAELLPLIDATLEDLQGLEARFDRADRLTGTLRITCLSGVGYRLMAPVVAEFTRRHPDIRIELDLSERMVDLIESRTDMAIRIDKPTTGELIYRRLASNDLMLTATPAYLKRHKPLRDLKDLHAHPVFMTSPLGGCRFLGTPYRLGDFVSTQTVRCDSGLFLTELALEGAGVVVRPTWDAHALIREGKLVHVLPRFPLENYGEIYAVIPSRRCLAARVRAFMDFLTEQAAAWTFTSRPASTATRRPNPARKGR